MVIWAVHDTSQRSGLATVSVQTMMDSDTAQGLILWRHAEAELAETSGSDASQALTPRVQKQAARMALRLDKHLPAATRITYSPATRCVETVSALKRNYKLRDELSMNARA